MMYIIMYVCTCPSRSGMLLLLTCTCTAGRYVYAHAHNDIGARPTANTYSVNHDSDIYSLILTLHTYMSELGNIDMFDFTINYSWQPHTNVFSPSCLKKGHYSFMF